MTVITFANSKGGVGKSTLCLLVATELATSNVKVLVLDADKQKSCFKWYQRCEEMGTLPPCLTIEAIAGVEHLGERLDSKPEADVILIDVQGSMHELLTAAIVASNLTIVPTSPVALEVIEAITLFQWARNLRRAPLRLAVNRVDGLDVRTDAFKHAINLIIEHKLPCLPNFVRERKIFKEFTLSAGSLSQLGEKPSKRETVDKARANIRDFIKDIFNEAIAEDMKGKQAHVA